MRILAYCLMPNHWHLLLWPEQEGQLASFMQRLTTTHVRRWRLFRRSVGAGHLYQGTCKSFPAPEDEHFYPVCSYVDRNALRANLVATAQEWPFGSLWQRLQGPAFEDRPILSPWPLPCSFPWTDYVNQPETEAELKALDTSLRRGRPFGGGDWQQKTAEHLGLVSTLRPRGRPRKMV